MLFMDFLREHRAGTTHTRITEAMRRLVAAVVEENRPGKITVTIAMKPLGKSDGYELMVDVKESPPQPVPGSSIFFATPENNLTRADPRQQVMDLREIPPSEAHRGLA